MGSNVCSRGGASGGGRPRPPFRLAFGVAVIELMPGGRVRVVAPAAAEFRDLGAFLAAMRKEGA